MMPLTGIVVRGRVSVRDRAAGGSATAIAERHLLEEKIKPSTKRKSA
jgi:hypothetical protein